MTDDIELPLLPGGNVAHIIAAQTAEIEALRADVAEWKARADDLATALRNCLKLARNCYKDELPSAIITTASKAVANYDMLVDFSAALDDRVQETGAEGEQQ